MLVAIPVEVESIEKSNPKCNGPSMRIRQAIEKAGARHDLEREEARNVMEVLLSGTVPDDQIVELLTALRDKGERPAEIIGFAEVMRSHARETLRHAGVTSDDVAALGPLLDTCGTGGDGRGTFNVSTATALVVAGSGVRVAKHGNRSISSRCGSADVLEALGVKIDLPLDRIPACLEEAGMVFLFAPHIHLAMKHVMGARRKIKTKTVFNLLGPLTNPLAASAQLAGVYDPARTEMLAEALAVVGTRRAFVVAGSDGIDEITTTGPTRLSCYDTDRVRTREVNPEDFGLPLARAEALAGADPAHNARLLVRILEGDSSPLRHCVLANASAALVAFGKTGNFREGAAMAEEAIDSGRARSVLASLVEFTRKAKP
jgi:anthranilate phosphoribosyltransferase